IRAAGATQHAFPRCSMRTRKDLILLNSDNPENPDSDKSPRRFQNPCRLQLLNFISGIAQLGDNFRTVFAQ
ncbi:MAG: hypothetical protein RL368_1224, partial [Pseudomonadota bacterium]